MDAKRRKRVVRQAMPITITGLLVPDKWDEQGAITGLALLTGDEGKYLIKPDDNLAPLLPVLRRTIALQGTVRMEKGKKLFFYQALALENNGQPETAETK